MEMTVSLNLSRDEVFKLHDLCNGAKAQADAIVTGIVQLYLSGKVQAQSPNLEQQRLVEAVVAAVDRYRGKPSQAQPQPRQRIGRPALLSEADVAHAVLLRDSGQSCEEIGEKFGVGHWVVRRALKRAGG
jgi:hypothetical protein